MIVNGWHDLCMSQTDLPKKDGFYEITYIREDGKQRSSKAFYRLKPKKSYYRDRSGATKVKIDSAGWNIQNTAKVSSILAWRAIEPFVPQVKL